MRGILRTAALCQILILGLAPFQARAEESASPTAPDEPAAAEVLRRMQSSTDPETRADGVELPAVESAEEAWKALAEGGPAAQHAALQVLGESDADALAAGFVRHLARLESGGASAFAARAAPLRATMERPLVDLLTRPSAPRAHRLRAAQALGLLRLETAAEPLARLAWTSPDLAAACARALCEMEQEAARKVLAGLCGHPDRDVRQWAVEGLARLGGDLARDRLEAMVAGVERTPELRRQAALALGRIGDDGSVGVLVDSLRNDEWTRAAAMSALGQLTRMNWGTSYRQWINWYDAKARQERQEAEDRAANRPKVNPQSPLLPKVPPGFAPAAPEAGNGGNP